MNTYDLGYLFEKYAQMSATRTDPIRDALEEANLGTNLAYNPNFQNILMNIANARFQAYQAKKDDNIINNTFTITLKINPATHQVGYEISPGNADITRIVNSVFSPMIIRALSKAPKDNSDLFVLNDWLTLEPVIVE